MQNVNDNTRNRSSSGAYIAGCRINFAGSNLTKALSFVSFVSFVVKFQVFGGRCEKERSNTLSAMRFFRISIDPPAIIHPRHLRKHHSISVSVV
jgi:hypothetical protein